jgi:hypothetical protein
MTISHEKEDDINNRNHNVMPFVGSKAVFDGCLQ